MYIKSDIPMFCCECEKVMEGEKEVRIELTYDGDDGTYLGGFEIYARCPVCGHLMWKNVYHNTIGEVK